MVGFAVMSVEKVEAIVAALVSGHIPGTGRYKFLAKKNAKGMFEWAHFTERDNGAKENVYRGEIKEEKELKLVLDIINRNLQRIFGDNAELKEGIPEFRSLFGEKPGGIVN